MRRILGVLSYTAFLCLADPTPACAGSVVVNAADQYDYTGVVASPGQVFDLTATGQVNLAIFDGPYITNANGTIIIAPPVGSGAYNYFYNRPPVGAPMVG